MEMKFGCRWSTKQNLVRQSGTWSKHGKNSAMNLSMLCLNCPYSLWKSRPWRYKEVYLCTVPRSTQTAKSSVSKQKYKSQTDNKNKYQR